jgi:hypothetical protein
MKILWSLLLTAILCSCNKSEVDAVTPNNNNTNGKLIRSYSIDDKWEYTYRYNNDNTLQEIVFKVDGEVQFTESFKYENGRIIESLKRGFDDPKTIKKQFEYKGNLIVKQIEDINGETSEISHFKYDNNILKKISLQGSNNGYEYSKITLIEKLAENQVKVTRKGVADHVITYDENEAPLCRIPGYKALLQINNNGISGNILLTEIYLGDELSTVIDADLEFDANGKTVIGSKTTFKSKQLDEVQVRKYKYK